LSMSNSFGTRPSRPLAQVLPKRLRLQLRSRLQQPSCRAPDGFQRIFSGPPVVGLLLLLARICLPQGWSVLVVATQSGSGTTRS
jgi:hypothetical protein